MTIEAKKTITKPQTAVMQPTARQTASQRRANPTALPRPQAVLQRALADPSQLSAAEVDVLQRTIGLRAAQRMLGIPPPPPLATLLQAKLTLGPAGDKYEQEADRTAKQVMNSLSAPTPTVQRHEHGDEVMQAKPLADGISRIQREELADDDDLQAKLMHGLEGGDVDSEVAATIERSKGGGKPLHDGVRTSMEHGFGTDFSSVRVHSDSQSDALNRSLNARAFTTGNDIFFGQGQYNPGSSAGQELIAHELTHTVQQGAAPQSVSRRIDVNQTVNPQTPPAVQRLVSSKTFKKRTSLTLRKGKSHSFFSRITQDLAAYHGVLQTSSASERLTHLEDMLQRVNDWLDTRDPNKTSRRDKVLSLKHDLEVEIQNLEPQLESVSSTDFSDDNLSEGQSGESKSGQMNTVKLLKYDFGVRNTDTDDLKMDGGTFEGFFKSDVDVDPMNDRHRGGEKAAGIPKNNPEFGKRNIAMYRIDKLLGANVVPPTFAARHGNKAGIVMAKIKGVTGAEASKDEDIDMDHPLIRQGLSKIYLLDVICAQVDRHSGNYMVVLENGVIKGVKAIDNDLAFGKNYDYDTNEEMSRFNKNFGPVAGKMPSELNEIDRNFAQKIIQLGQTPQLVRDALNGLVSNDEIDATITRLGKLVDFLTPLVNQNNGRIVTEWQ